MGEAEEERMPSWGLEPGRELGRGWAAGSDGKLCLRWGACHLLLLLFHT